jgi:hypothetical protein
MVVGDVRKSLVLDICNHFVERMIVLKKEIDGKGFNKFDFITKFRINLEFFDKLNTNGLIEIKKPNFFAGLKIVRDGYKVILEELIYISNEQKIEKIVRKEFKKRVLEVILVFKEFKKHI